MIYPNSLFSTTSVIFSYNFAEHQVLEENAYIRAETLKYVHEKQNPVAKDHLEKGLEHLTLEYLGAKSQRKGCKKLRK